MAVDEGGESFVKSAGRENLPHANLSLRKRSGTDLCRRIFPPRYSTTLRWASISLLFPSDLRATSALSRAMRSMSFVSAVIMREVYHEGFSGPLRVTEL